jgi:hypothetical protein
MEALAEVSKGNGLNKQLCITNRSFMEHETVFFTQVLILVSIQAAGSCITATLLYSNFCVKISRVFWKDTRHSKDCGNKMAVS